MPYHHQALLQQLLDPDLTVVRAGLRHTQTLVDYECAPELAGRVALCYRYGIGVAPDYRTALRYLCIYYHHKHCLINYTDDVREGLTLSQRHMSDILWAGSCRQARDYVVDASEGLNDIYSTVDSLPDILEATKHATTVVDGFAKLRQFASWGGYVLQFIAVIAAVVKDLWETRQAWQEKGFKRALAQALEKKDRWRCLTSAALWTLTAVLIIAVVPALELALNLIAITCDLVITVITKINDYRQGTKNRALFTQLLNKEQDAITTLEKSINTYQRQLNDAKMPDPGVQQALVSAKSELVLRKRRCEQYRSAMVQSAKDSSFDSIDSVITIGLMGLYVFGTVLSVLLPIAGFSIILIAMIFDVIKQAVDYVKEQRESAVDIPEELIETTPTRPEKWKLSAHGFFSLPSAVNDKPNANNYNQSDFTQPVLSIG